MEQPMVPLVSRPAATEPGKEPTKKNSGWQVLAVQSIACVVILLLAVLIRVAGGTAFEQLRRSFNDTMMNNTLLETLASLWDVPPEEPLSDTVPDVTAPQPGAEASDSTTSPDASTDQTTTTSSAMAGEVAPEGTAGRYPPAGMLAVSLRVNRVAVPPVKDGTLSSGYGYRESPTGRGEQFHAGLDIAAAAGTPVAAMFFGVVKETGENSSYGKYIRLDHGAGVQVLYAHCSVIVAEKGIVVRAGDTVARVGSTGDSTGDHVHVEVFCNGIRYNPAGIVPVARYV